MNHELKNMNINRNNYEEFFLLYIDNELSVAEKNAVDAFVAANPDLYEELVMLQQSVIKPNSIEFPGKEKLIKRETVNIATTEKLLMLLDNELDGKEKDGLLSLIQNNKAVGQEWELLQQTKLSPADTIIFGDKVLLYKKEAGKVVPIRWWRAAAAAMLIGFGLWGTVSYFNKTGQAVTSTGSAVVKTNKPAGSNNKNTDPGIAAVKVAENSNTIKTVTTATAKENPIVNTVLPANRDNKSVAVVPVQNDSKNNVVAVPENNINDTVDSDNINNDDSNKKIFTTVEPETQTNKIESTSEIPSALPNTMAVNTSFKSETGEKNSFAFEDDEDRPKKTKLGGFFKKVKRVIERKTKIKTGDDDEVRIANMSFAMH